MKLLEALEIVRKAPAADARPFRVFLACGFTPLYLKSYLHAYLRQALPDRAVSIETGIFGDVAGELERISTPDVSGSLNGCAVAIEWPDLDERLGYRSAGGWRVAKIREVQDTAVRSLDRLSAAILRLADRVPVALSTPALPPAPLSFSRPDHGSSMFWEMEGALAAWAGKLAEHERITVVNPQWLDAASPAGERADHKSNLTAGYPYTLGHTDVLAGSLASMLAPAAPAKALITDLDDTLWNGILGEVGADGVQWSLEDGAQEHGLYQQFVQSLADAGVLVGVASKNDNGLVDQILSERKDLFLDPGCLFPREVSWGAKSESVARILKAWNIGAGDVVFLDDSPMEVAEVAAAHPGIRAIVFPKKDPAAVIDLLTSLRLMFGKRSVSEEDRIRSGSLRTAAVGSYGDEVPADHATASDGFLRSANAVIRLDCTLPPRDGRALELVNKTNQFNLNGIRYTESEWDSMLRQPGAFVCVVSYEDRFGPLGRIAVAAGAVDTSGVPAIPAWVMSCRAFSRRIEHACLRFLFDHLGATAIRLKFVPTSRNSPLQQFLQGIPAEMTEEGCVVRREDFDASCPALYHEVVVDAPAKAIPAEPGR